MESNEAQFMLTIEKGGYNLTEQPDLGIVQYTIDDGELSYLMEQIKHNLPFVIVLDNDIITFSPSQCVSIRISPIKREEK